MIVINVFLSEYPNFKHTPYTYIEIKVFKVDQYLKYFNKQYF